jgi:hypothetical protein
MAGRLLDERLELVVIAQRNPHLGDLDHAITLVAGPGAWWDRPPGNPGKELPSDLSMWPPCFALKLC